MTTLQSPLTQARFALDQIVADIRTDLANGMTEEEIASDWAHALIANPMKGCSMAVIAAIELAKQPGPDMPADSCGA